MIHVICLLRCTDTLDPGQFGPKTFWHLSRSIRKTHWASVLNCLDILALMLKCLTDILPPRKTLEHQATVSKTVLAFDVIVHSEWLVKHWPSGRWPDCWVIPILYSRCCMMNRWNRTSEFGYLTERVNEVVHSSKLFTWRNYSGPLVKFLRFFAVVSCEYDYEACGVPSTFDYCLGIMGLCVITLKQWCCLRQCISLRSCHDPLNLWPRNLASRNCTNIALLCGAKYVSICWDCSTGD